MSIGPRILKTGLAVAISMYICIFFNIQPAIFAAAATVVNLQQSVGKSLRNAYEQIIVHFIAVGIGILLGLFIHFQPLSMGIATIVIISICSKVLKWKASISMGVVAAIFILGAPANEFIHHALVRSLAIFIGLGVAILINMLIAPPRYNQIIIGKLLELNTLTSEYFKDSVHSFLTLTLPAPELKINTEAAYQKILADAEKYYELHANEWNIGDTISNTEQKKLYNDYIHYNKGLWQRSKDILFLAEERIERRKNALEPPISQEFREILDLLLNALQITGHYNEELQRKVKGEKTEILPEPRIWSKLDIIINHWHDHFPSGSFYLHALIEISLVTYKIRWAAKESARLLNTGI
ncbi:MAG: FUSC family protein [Peptococcaceae bacterium]